MKLIMSFCCLFICTSSMAKEIDFNYCHDLSDQFKFNAIYRTVFEGEGSLARSTYEPKLRFLLSQPPIDARRDPGFEKLTKFQVNGKKGIIAFKPDEGNSDVVFKTELRENKVIQIYGPDTDIQFYIANGVCIPLAFHFIPKDKDRDFDITNCSELKSVLPRPVSGVEAEFKTCGKENPGWLSLGTLKGRIIQDPRLQNPKDPRTILPKNNSTK